VHENIVLGVSVALVVLAGRVSLADTILTVLADTVPVCFPTLVLSSSTTYPQSCCQISFLLRQPTFQDQDALAKLEGEERNGSGVAVDSWKDCSQLDRNRIRMMVRILAKMKVVEEVLEAGDPVGEDLLSERKMAG
jgi:hypothetical protein